MADYTYYLYDGAPNTAPNFSSWGAIRSDFTGNNRMGAGTGVIGSGVLYIKVRGNVTGGGNFNFVAAAGVSVGAGGSCIIEADTNPWDASTSNAAAFSTSFDGVTFGGDEGITTDLNNVTIRKLLLSHSLTGGLGVSFQQPTSSMTQAIEDCVLQQTLNNSSGVLGLSANAIARNCVIYQRSTNSSAFAVDVNLRHSTNPTIEHCTVISNSANSQGMKDSQSSGSTATNIKNTYCGGATTPWGGLSAGSAAGNASSSTDAPGTGAVNNIAVSTTNFENVTGDGNWKVKSTSALATTGATRLSGLTTDAYGVNRQNPTTIGAHEALAVAPVITLDAGSYSISGQAVTTRIARTTSLENGSYSWSGQNVNLVYTQPGVYTLPLDPGSYLFTGSDALVDLSMVLVNGSYSITGQSVDFALGVPAAYSISLENSSYTWNGRPVRLAWSEEPVGNTKQTNLSISLRMGL